MHNHMNPYKQSFLTAKDEEKSRRKIWQKGRSESLQYLTVSSKTNKFMCKNEREASRS